MYRSVFILLFLLYSLECYSFFDIENNSVRAGSMANAFTGIADDWSAGFYNPAGLGCIKRVETGSTFSLLYSGLDTEQLNSFNAGIVVPVPGIIHAGINYYTFELSGVYKEQYTQLSVSKRLNDFLFLRKIHGRDELYLGLNIKIFKQNFQFSEYAKSDPLIADGKDNISNLGIDSGMLYKFYYAKNSQYMCIGVAFFNLNQPSLSIEKNRKTSFFSRIGEGIPALTEALIDDDDTDSGGKLPVITRIGLGIPFQAQTIADGFIINDILLGIAMTIREERISLHFGWENSIFKQMLFLRLGSSLSEATAGFGYKTLLGKSSNLILDYGYILPYSFGQSSGKHLIGFKLQF